MSPRATARLPALRYWRTQRALKQAELGERAGIHWTTVQRLEGGKPAEVETVRRLAEALGVEPSDLMREPPDQ